jgi:hypothetical protein
MEESCFFILIYVNLNGLGATDGNVFISVHKDYTLYKAVNYDRYLVTLFCVPKIQLPKCFPEYE